MFIHHRIEMEFLFSEGAWVTYTTERLGICVSFPDTLHGFGMHGFGMHYFITVYFRVPYPSLCFLILSFPLLPAPRSALISVELGSAFKTPMLYTGSDEL